MTEPSVRLKLLDSLHLVTVTSSLWHSYFLVTPQRNQEDHQALILGCTQKLVNLVIFSVSNYCSEIKVVRCVFASLGSSRTWGLSYTAWNWILPAHPRVMRLLATEISDQMSQQCSVPSKPSLRIHWFTLSPSLNSKNFPTPLGVQGFLVSYKHPGLLLGCILTW